MEAIGGRLEGAAHSPRTDVRNALELVDGDRDGSGARCLVEDVDGVIEDLLPRAGCDDRVERAVEHAVDDGAEQLLGHLRLRRAADQIRVPAPPSASPECREGAFDDRALSVSSRAQEEDVDAVTHPALEKTLGRSYAFGRNVCTDNG